MVVQNVVMPLIKEYPSVGILIAGAVITTAMIKEINRLEKNIKLAEAETVRVTDECNLKIAEIKKEAESCIASRDRKIQELETTIKELQGKIVCAEGNVVPVRKRSSLVLLVRSSLEMLRESFEAVKTYIRH